MLFRDTKGTANLVLDYNYDKKIADKYVKTEEDKIQLDTTESQTVLIMLFNVQNITDHIIKNSLKDTGWKNLDGLIITMYPTTNTSLNTI